MLRKYRTTLVNVPQNKTVQPFDVYINKPYKMYKNRLFEHHLDADLPPYANGKFIVRERSILTTKWVSSSRGSNSLSSRDNL